MTVTLNAAVDKTLRVSNLQIGLRHRCAQGLVQPGGKGINVARALKALGQPVLATGLAGGRTGTRIVEELTAAGILNDFVRIQDESRTSTLLVDPALGTSTEIVEYGPVIAPNELETVSAKLAYLMRGVSTAVFAGSLPRDVPEDWYAGALRDARKAHLQTVLDSEGEPLRLGLAGEPDLVAPNQLEAEELAGFEFQTPADFASGMDRIVDMGARNVIITHGTGCAALIREPGNGPRSSRSSPSPRSARATRCWPGSWRRARRTARSRTCCATLSAAARRTRRRSAPGRSTPEMPRASLRP
jgi:1-phosphofructokinase/tagatose 6-phosphate kinase